MQVTTVKQHFLLSQACVVHQTGDQLTEPSAGVVVVLHTRENEKVPCSAEIVSGGHYADIGLWFEGMELIDYDGIFSLPREVGVMLQAAGFVVPPTCFS